MSRLIADRSNEYEELLKTNAESKHKLQEESVELDNLRRFGVGPINSMTIKRQEILDLEEMVKVLREIEKIHQDKILEQNVSFVLIPGHQ